jgi:hypothetical protein
MTEPMTQGPGERPQQDDPDLAGQSPTHDQDLHGQARDVLESSEDDAGVEKTPGGG